MEMDVNEPGIEGGGGMICYYLELYRYKYRRR